MLDKDVVVEVWPHDPDDSALTIMKYWAKNSNVPFVKLANPQGITYVFYNEKDHVIEHCYEHVVQHVRNCTTFDVMSVHKAMRKLEEGMPDDDIGVPDCQHTFGNVGFNLLTIACTKCGRSE
jgi:hypothetical protein